MPVIGYLYEGSPEPTAQLLAAFRKGLSETGYVEGDEVAQSGLSSSRLCPRVLVVRDSSAESR
jgi:hypothetical protein